jgi:predicted nucleic acid-binding protein
MQNEEYKALLTKYRDLVAEYEIVKVQREEARREAEMWRDHWKNRRVMSMIVSSKMPWEK